MKIAVLLSGEYRTFRHCRKTMSFLDDPRVDIYVSIWNTSTYKSPAINLDVTEWVDRSQVIRHLGKSAVDILIDSQNIIKEVKYNTKMIYRWKAGIEMIKKSGIHYDYIIILRPDLFFRHGINLDHVKNYSDSLGVAWAIPTSLENKKLGDVLFLSSYHIMVGLFNQLKVESWTQDREYDWHKWWYNFCEKKVPLIKEAREFDHCTFYRYITRDSSSFDSVFRSHQDWRDLHIIYQLNEHGRDFLKGIWPEDIIKSAEDKWNSGYFRKVN